jgi:UPF0148 protein
MEDKKISEAAKALIRGAKMLSHHCPECKVPLFEEDERIYCPSCGRDVIIVSDDAEEEAEIVSGTNRLKYEEGKAEENLRHLIDELSSRLSSSSYSEMREILEIMLKAAEVLEKLKTKR